MPARRGATRRERDDGVGELLENLGYADGMAEIFEQFADAIITLSARGAAPHGHASTGDPVFCSLWTLTGLPAVNVPVLNDADGLPIGVQLIGARGRDERLLRTANALIGMVAPAKKSRRARAKH